MHEQLPFCYSRRVTTNTAPALLKPRDYQIECIKAIHGKWDAGVWRPASVLPTGAGKTVVFSHLAETYLASNPGRRVLILSHTEELGDQAAEKMSKIAPHRSVGIVRAGRNEVLAQVISASVQTLRTAKRRAAIRNVGLIIVDECHHAVARTYRAVLEHFGALPGEDAGPDWKPSCRVAGFTATLVRGDKEKLSDVWQDVAYRKDIAFMIRRGYLLDVKGRRIVVPDLDLSHVKVSGGDYQDSALADELEASFAPEVVAQGYVEHAKDRKGILFAPTVASAEHFAAALLAEGIPAEVLHGALPKEERRAVLARLRSGETQVVCNCMVLTEGFDDPTVSCAVIARPTKSGGLYQQMVGRVLRPDLTLPPAERGHALVLDVTGVSRRHDLRSLIDLTDREDLKDRDGELEEDLSLLELEELETEGEGEAGVEWYVGPVGAEDFDPLARDSSRTWSKTADGYYWLPAGSFAYVVLVPSVSGEPGAFDVVWMSALDPAARLSAKDRESLREAFGDGPYAGMTEHRGLSFEMALNWGEEAATDIGGHGALTLSSRKAAWRKLAPSAAQVRYARSLGIDPPENDLGLVLWDKGQLSDAIGERKATARIDPLVRMVLGR